VTGSAFARLSERKERMRLFLDTANLEEIREINRWGVLSGITTNPTLVSKEHEDPEALWKEILAEVDGDVSLETTEPDADPMYKQGLHLAQMGPNAVVKVPMTPDGLEAGKRLVADGIRINVTLVFSPGQAILAAEIGAYIVSPFLGRIDDVAATGCTRSGRSARSMTSKATIRTSSRRPSAIPCTWWSRPSPGRTSQPCRTTSS